MSAIAQLAASNIAKAAQANPAAFGIDPSQFGSQTSTTQQPAQTSTTQQPAQTSTTQQPAQSSDSASSILPTGTYTIQTLDGQFALGFTQIGSIVKLGMERMLWKFTSTANGYSIRSEQPLGFLQADVEGILQLTVNAGNEIMFDLIPVQGMGVDTFTIQQCGTSNIICALADEPESPTSLESPLAFARVKQWEIRPSFN